MKKRSAIAAICVLFICVAVYLNWNAKTLQSDESRVEATLGTEKPEENPDENSAEPKEEVKTSADAGSYFAEARLEKQKARDAAISTLKEAINEENISEESRDKAASSIETLSTGAVAENRIETLVKAKGYKDCVALINESGINIIVSAPQEGFSAADITKIKDIAVSETGVTPGKIKIIEIK